MPTTAPPPSAHSRRSSGWGLCAQLMEARYHLCLLCLLVALFMFSVCTKQINKLSLLTPPCDRDRLMETSRRPLRCTTARSRSQRRTRRTTRLRRSSRTQLRGCRSGAASTTGREERGFNGSSGARLPGFACELNLARRGASRLDCTRRTSLPCCKCCAAAASILLYQICAAAIVGVKMGDCSAEEERQRDVFIIQVVRRIHADGPLHAVGYE